MSNYSRGYTLENQVTKKLLSKGWVAWRSAGSHSPCDVIAVDKEGQVHFIQLKKTKNGYFNKQELRNFKKWETGICVFKHFWVWKVGEGWIFQWDEEDFRIDI